MAHDSERAPQLTQAVFCGPVGVARCFSCDEVLTVGQPEDEMVFLADQDCPVFVEQPLDFLFGVHRSSFLG
jgi:hypothetical protein